MVIGAELAVPRRLVTIDGNGHLHPVDGEPIDVVADELFSVIVAWDRQGADTWSGVLTTVSRRAVSFSAQDLEDPIFQNWLRALPGWEHAHFWEATTTPGIYLVWRRGT